MANRPGVRIIWRLLLYYFRGFHNVDILQPCPISPQGPAILVSNHISGIDPLVLQLGCPRLVVWMMAREYYEVRSLRRVFESVDCIPVERSGRDLAATRQAMRVLEQGRVLGIFPEGRISPDAQVLPFQTGVGLMALRSGAPIYPAYLQGTTRGTEMIEAFLYPHRITVSYGPAVRLAETKPRPTIEEATNMIHAAVAALGAKSAC